MILESRLKYKVQILLQLSKMTSDLATKEKCITEIRTLLGYLDVTTSDSDCSLTSEFVGSLSDDEIAGRTMSDIYQMFRGWCGDPTEALDGKLFKTMVAGRGFINKQSWTDGKNKRIFCKVEEESK